MQKVYTLHHIYTVHIQSIYHNDGDDFITVGKKLTCSLNEP